MPYDMSDAHFVCRYRSSGEVRSGKSSAKGEKLALARPSQEQ
jgi:hypothetical protein